MAVPGVLWQRDETDRAAGGEAPGDGEHGPGLSYRIEDDTVVVLDISRRADTYGTE